jgi:hypothetical protein
VSNQFTDGEMNEGVTLCSVVVQPSILIARIAVIVAITCAVLVAAEPASAASRSYVVVLRDSVSETRTSRRTGSCPHASIVLHSTVMRPDSAMRSTGGCLRVAP